MRRLLLSLFVLLATANIADAQIKKPILTIAADMWCPINCSPVASQAGIGIELAKRAFEPLGYEVRYTLMSWDDALKAVREGKIDAIVGAGRTDDPKLIFPENPITEVSDDFFVAKGNPWRFQGLYTLRNKRIGVTQGYGYGKDIKSYIDSQRNVAGMIYEAKGTEPLNENIEKLVTGKLDIVIESRPVMEYTLHELGKQDRVIWAGGLSNEFVYLAFSPVLAQSKGRAMQYDATINALKAGGQLAAIYQPYGLKP